MWWKAELEQHEKIKSRPRNEREILIIVNRPYILYRLRSEMIQGLKEEYEAFRVCHLRDMKKIFGF